MGQTEHKRAKIRRLRPGVQIVCLGLFLYLAFAARFRWKSLIPYDLFLRVNPVVWLLVSASTREFALYGSFALVLTIVTALLGRVFCGWVCPLGTVIDAGRLVWDRKPKDSLVKRLSNIRFLVLIVLIGAAIAGVNLAGWLDPLVMSTRALNIGSGARLDPATAAVRPGYARHCQASHAALAKY